MSNHVGLYLRMSQDASGEGAGVGRQRADCLPIIEDAGWTLVDIYTDNDRGATSTGNRPEFDRLISDIETGKVTRIVAWARDRLSRNLFDTARLEDVAKRHGTIITVHPGRDYDLRDPSDMLNFQVLGAVAGFETGQKHKRQIARVEQDRMAGVPYMRTRPFGYLPNPAKVGRKGQNPLDCTVLHPVESEAIRRVYADFHSGKERRLGRVAEDWNRRGLRTVNGKRWLSSTINRVLRNPLYAGIQYRVVKDGTQRRYELFREVVPQWTPLVSREIWDDVQEVLEGRSLAHHSGNRGFRQTWMTGVLRCVTCGGKMHKNRDRLRCVGPVNHSLSIGLEDARQVVENYVIGTIALEGRSLGLADPNADKISAIRSRLAEIEAVDLPAVQAIKSTAYRVHEINALTDEQNRLHGELTSLRAGRSILGVIADLGAWATGGTVSMANAADNVRAVEATWGGLSDSQKHEIANTLAVYIVREAAKGLQRGDRIEIYPRDPITGRVSPHSINEDPNN